MKHAEIDSALTVAGLSLAAVVALGHPWVVAVVVTAVVVACRLSGAHRPGHHAIALALVVGSLAAWRAHRAIARDGEAASATVAALPRPERCEVTGTVVSMPGMRSVLSADVLVESIVCDARAPPVAGVRARIHDLPEHTARGDRIMVIAQLAPSRRPHNPDLGDPRASYARRGHSLSGTALTVEHLAYGGGPRALIDRARARLRRGITTAFAVPDVASIARAMVLGEEDLTPDDDEAFRRSGLTHLLAVSGSHVALVVGTLVAMIRALLLRWTHLARRVEVARVAAAIGIPLACVYEQLSGDSGSARRATIMAVVVLAVQVAGRRVDLSRTLGLSVLAALAIDPLAPFDLSFALSIAATLGLIALGPAVDRRLLPLPRVVRSAFAATVAASVACAPFIAAIAGALPLLGLFANIVAVPIGELAALPLCNIAALGGAVLPPLASRAIGDAASGSLLLLRGVARIAAAPELAVVSVPPPTAAQTGILIAAVASVMIARAHRFVIGLLGLAAVLLCEVSHLRASRPQGVLGITVLDVGQGDATLIDFPHGGAMLVDAGGEVGSSWDPGRAVVAPVLRARRRRALDVVVLSHPHPDHFLGLRAALAGVRVGEFWHNGEVTHGGELGALVASLRARSVSLSTPSSLCGPRTISGALVEVLHPCPGPDPDRGANDNSLVLRISFGRRSVLLVGDAEHLAEEKLLEHPERLRADILKVGHHGSRTSSSRAFLAAVQPSIATISCGVRNRFGHPHVAALTALHESGARVLRTDLMGAIRITTDGEQVDVGW